jgi:predicted protein tyrosine phosphatase
MPQFALAQMAREIPNLLERCFVISICQPGDADWPFQIEHPRLLNLSFDDLGPEELSEETRSGYTFMSEDDARATVAFIERCHALDARGTLIAQCTAGVSRSGAVARFTRELLRLDPRRFKRLNRNTRPHPYILQMLRVASGSPDLATRRKLKYDYEGSRRKTRPSRQWLHGDINYRSRM